MAKLDRLSIQNFAQIAEANLRFGDLTVLVGAQGTGKSLALQWLKVAMDGRQIVDALRAAGHTPDEDQVLIDLIFGVGMGSAWGPESKVLFTTARTSNPSASGGSAPAWSAPSSSRLTARC